MGDPQGDWQPSQYLGRTGSCPVAASVAQSSAQSSFWAPNGLGRTMWWPNVEETQETLQASLGSWKLEAPVPSRNLWGSTAWPPRGATSRLRFPLGGAAR